MGLARGRSLGSEAHVDVVGLAGTRVLVTGASGFVGARVVERLVADGARVRVLVREIARAAPLSRFPVEIAAGDLLRPAEVNAAVDGCDVVIHCAKGSSGTRRERQLVNLDGTRHLLDAAAAASVARVVHISTVVVYDLPAAGSLDESALPTRSKDAYAVSKREGEELALAYGRQGRVAVTVVQPTIVYGPRAGVYGREILEELRSTRLPLVDAGEGICNALFVDDLVTALMLAATSERAPGERFLISGPEPVTWRAFFAAFEDMLGVRRTVPVSREAALRLWRRQARRPWLAPEAFRALRTDAHLRDRLLSTREGTLVRRAAQRALPASFFAPKRWEPPTEPAGTEPPLVALRPEIVDFLACRATVGSDKARRLLGYEPVFDLDAGMTLTAQWARHEGLLDPPGTA